jgi:hypothetical protein
VCEGDGLDVDEGDGLLGVGADEGNVGAVLGGDVLLGDVVFGHEGLAGGDLEVGAVEGARKEFADAAGDGLLEAVVDAAAVRASEDVYADRADGCALGARRETCTPIGPMGAPWGPAGVWTVHLLQKMSLSMASGRAGRPRWSLMAVCRSRGRSCGR